MEGGPARWQKVSDAVAGFLRADGKLAPIYAQAFCLDPEIFAGLLAVSFRVGNDRIDQFQNIFLTADRTQTSFLL